MKGTIFEIKRFAVHDGDGIRTTVFMKGCPLRCIWCHNPEGLRNQKELSFIAHKCVGCGACAAVCPQGAHVLGAEGTHSFDRAKCISCGLCEKACPTQALKLYGFEMSVEELLPLLLEDIDFYENSGGGVTLSGGECLMQADFCAALLKRLKENHVHTAVDTCGFVPRESIDKVMPYTDVFLYDLKAVDEMVHTACTRQSNRLILDNLSYIDQCGKQVEIRIPYVPQYNADQLPLMADLLASLKNLVKVRVLPYHNYAGSKYESLGMENRLPPQVPENAEIQQAVELLRARNIKVV